MKSFFKYILPFLSLLLLFTCNLPGPTPGANPRTITISGSITSIEDNSPVANATVIIRDVQVASDADGHFAITVDHVTDNDSFKIKCPDYADYLKSLSNFPGSDMLVDVTLKPVDVVAVINPARAEGNRISTIDKASVFIPKLTGITGNLIISLTNYDVGTEEINCAPGDFSAAGNGILISQGMIDVSVTREDTGAPVDLSGLGSYEITIPITGDINSAPDTIPLWYFNAASCTWVEQGSAQRSATDPDVYVGTVSHFTPWNCDMRIPPINIYWQIEDLSLDNQTYQTHLVVNGYAATFYGNAKEYYSSTIPRSMFIKITVTKMNTGVAWTRYFFSNNASGCIDLGVFPGPGALPEVIGLSATVDEHAVTVSWMDEPAEITGVEIEYAQLGSTAVRSVYLPTGVMTRELTGLTPGPYIVVVKTYDAAGNESVGLLKKVRIDDACLVRINNSFTDHSIIYAFNGSNVFIIWPGVDAIIPRKTKIILDIDSANKGNHYWSCNGMGYYDFPQEFSVDDDLTITLWDSCS